jgi:TPP-dependent pyruvate/acetoin dehydrogenase alpha subunit
MEKRDPIPTFKITCEAKWITTDEIIAFEQKIEAKVQLAVDFAERETGSL